MIKGDGIMKDSKETHNDEQQGGGVLNTSKRRWRMVRWKMECFRT